MAKAKLPFKEFIWTPALAYVVGLLVTDGNLSSAIFVGGIILKDKNYFLQQIESFKARKEVVVKLFQDKKFTVYDTSTNFLVVRNENIEKIVNQLKEDGILVSGISDYPFSFDLLKNMARIAIPSENDLPTLEKALNKL